MRELDTLGIAYHSPALMPFCDKLHSVLSAVVPHPKERSKRWLFLTQVGTLGFAPSELLWKTS